MKQYISANIQYFKHNNSIKDIKHIKRDFFDDKNVYKDKTKNNITYNINSYDELRAKHKDTIKKEISKNANTLIDCVVSFSFDQFEKIKNDKAGLTICTKKLVKKIQEEYGFTPISVNFHFDEGHYNEDGKFINNYHAHFLFYNYDFKNKNAPLRNFRNNKSAFSRLQDICQESYQELGFKRGISKKITKKEHLQKKEYLEEKLKEKEKLVTLVEEKVEDLKLESKKITQVISEKRDYINNSVLLESDKVQFSNLKNVLESKKFENVVTVYNDLQKNTYFSQISKLFNPFISFFKKVYNSMHRFYLNEESHFEKKEKEELAKKLKEQLDLMDEDFKNRKSRRTNSLFPKLTRR